MEAHLRAGIAIYNAGGYHDAHDAWEDYWLELDAGTDDERFLHGLIQFTAAAYHAERENWEGVQGLAESAGEYLADLPATYRGVALDPVRAYLSALATDPTHARAEAPPPLEHHGQAIRPGDLDVEATMVAADVLAEALDDVDEAIIEDAIRYARGAVESGGSDRFVTLLFDFVRDPDHRETAYARLASLVRRRRDREGDVEGLFDP